MNRDENYKRAVEDLTHAAGPPLAKVVSADNGEPVSGVIVQMTLIGPDGGDGGFAPFITDEAGVAFSSSNWRLGPGRYQDGLRPDPKSRFSHTEWQTHEPYIVVADDGTTAIPTLRLSVDTGG